MKNYRVAIAGCGKVADLHAEALRELPQAGLVAVWNRTFERAQAFAARYGALAYEELAEMVSGEAVDLVIVCTTHPSHLEVTREAAKAGAHVLVEKPLASCLSDADAMIEACESAGVKLGVICQRRWYEPAVRMKRAIEDGKIGRPILASLELLGWRDPSYYESDAWRGTWELEGGGVLVNQAPHMLDLLLWYLGDVAEVYGVWKNQNHPSIEVEDTAVATVTFQSGAVASLVASNSQNPGLFGRVRVHGSNGATIGAQTEGGSMFIAGQASEMDAPFNDLWTIPGEATMVEAWKKQDAAAFESVDPKVHYIKLQIGDMLEAIDKGREPIVDGYAGRRVVELFTGIYRSMRDGAPVRFPLKPELGRDDFDGRLSQEKEGG